MERPAAAPAAAPASQSKSGGEAQESEAEDEADGWEILQRAPRPENSRLRAWSGSVVSPRPVGEINEAPEDLVMGCLDPECDAQFGEGCDRLRCDGCHLPFCERHLAPWPMGRQWPSQRPPCAEPCGGGAGGSSGSSCAAGTDNRADTSVVVVDGPASLAGPVAALLESLGMPVGSVTALCRECRVDLSFTAPAIGGPVLGPPLAASSRRTSQQPPDPAGIAAEAQALRAVTLAKLRAAPAAGRASQQEHANVTVARGLLLRLLARLRLCLRPWAEQERVWVWRLREELVETEPGWLAQFARKADWDVAEEAKGVAQLIEKAHARRSLDAREAVQVLAALGRRAVPAVAALGERFLGLIATHAAVALMTLDEAELACVLEVLLDAGEALGAVGATGGRRAIVGTLLRAAHGQSAAAQSLRGELFWALEARAAAAAVAAPVPLGGPVSPAEAWASGALEELLRDLTPEDELGLLRQRLWVRHLERGNLDAARVEPGWGDGRAFPIAVWPAERRCLGLHGQPREATSKTAPVILRCRCRGGGTGAGGSHDGAAEVGGPSTATTSGVAGSSVAAETAGLVLKRGSGMHREQQVGQTLRLLEHLIWEDPGLRGLLEGEGLSPEDVRATYVIAMTGPGTAIVETVEGVTLRNVRGGRGFWRGREERGWLLEFLRQHNSSQDLELALRRLAFTAAVSAVLSFAAGLGDRHHENFILAADGRLLHIDFGYSLGWEPLDSIIVHYAVQGERPVTTLQYEELEEALGPSLIKRVFWPVARGAFLRIRQHAGLLLEMVQTAVVRDQPRRDPRGGDPASARALASAQAFIARRCVMVMSEPYAERFIYALLWHCGRHERGSQFRDDLKDLCLREKTQQAMVNAYNAAVATGRTATAAAGLAASGAAPALSNATSAAKGAAAGLIGGVRELLAETGPA